MKQPLLFNAIPFVQLSGTTNVRVRRRIELLKPADFASHTASEISSTLYNENRIAPVSLQMENATLSYPEEIPVEVDDETAPQGKRLVDGRRFQFSIPFTGNAAMLQVLPTTASTAPFGMVKEDHIYFTLEHAANGNIEDITTAYELNKNRLAGNATTLGQNVEAYNAMLQTMINTGVAARQARLQKDIAGVESMGIPLTA